MTEEEATAQLPVIHVVTETRNLKSTPFIIPEDNNIIGGEWEDWLDGIEREFRYFKITEPADKTDALIIYGGKEISRLAKSLPDPNDGNSYEKLKTKLNNYFVPKQNKHHARYQFLKEKPAPGESITAYTTRLREKAKRCEFGEANDERILEHIIQTIDDKAIIQKTISKKWDLTQFLQEVSQIEDVNRQVMEMKTHNNEGNNVARVGAYRPTSSRMRGSRTKYRKQNQSQECKTEQPCSKCGYHHKGNNRCPAYGKQCSNCSKWNHFASVCQSSNRSTQQKPIYPRKIRSGKIRKTEEEASTSSDDEYFQKSVQTDLHAKKITNNPSTKKTMIVQLDDVDVEIEPDSGSDVNLMDEHQFKALSNRSKSKLTLSPSKAKLNTLQHKLDVKGEFQTIIRNPTCGKHTRFVVVYGRINSPPLISKSTLLELGMMKIQEDGGLAQPNDMRMQNGNIYIKVAKQSTEEQEMMNIVENYSIVFDGIGKIHDKRNDKEIYGTFNMRSDAAPVAQKPRQVPYYLQEPFKKWIDEGVQGDIFEKVPDNEPITWCSPVVVQPKPNFVDTSKELLKPHMIRASVDLRVPNMYMERSRIIQPPIVEDFIHKFHDCNIWTKLDLRQGYHQLVLHPESRSIATFSTPWGNYRPKRLVFGAKASQDLFDDVMQKIFGDIPHCLNQRDDILIGARNWIEHNDTLKQVLQRVKDFGITLNQEKCQFGRSEVKFYGYKFNSQGLHPTEEKVKALKECSRPKSKTDVRSFLGMTGYLSKFIPRYASLTKPLRDLTLKETHFHWNKEKETAFQKLKDSISSQDVISFFNPKLPIMVRTEASFNEGLSAGLFQKTMKGWQPVHFISRTLTDTEKRYSQTEKDALCVKWAKERFSIYLLGAPRFTIVTAHKPLLTLFNKATANLPPRIEKWVMAMQDVDFEMKYQPGKDEQDPLDFLSRHPLPTNDDEDTEYAVKAIINDRPAVLLSKIREESRKDETLQKLRTVISKGNWENHRRDPDIIPFYSIKDELYIAEDLIFRLNKIVLPAKLQQKVINIAHNSGHLGSTKTKQMLRTKYWFPYMNSMVDHTVEQCFECKVTSTKLREEPIKPSVIPSKPWETISADFGGPYPDGHYNLVVIDKRTRYPEVEPTCTTGSKTTIEKFKKIFAHHGVPEKLETDNGPPFNSKDFEKFAENEGFIHHRITPLHPRANGEAERFMKLLNKTEQIAHLHNKDKLERNMAIQEMLMAYRDTPHPATGVSPYQAMNGRTIRTKLDYTPPIQEKPSRQDQLINRRDDQYKANMSNKTPAKEHSFIQGDYVLLKQRKVNKWTTPFEPAFYTVIKIQGSTVTARRIQDGREITRDASHFKLANSVMQNDIDSHSGDIPVEGIQDKDWREEFLRNSTKEEVEQPMYIEQIDNNPENNEQCTHTETQGYIDHSPQLTKRQQPTPQKGIESIPSYSQPSSERHKRQRRKPAYLRDYVPK